MRASGGTGGAPVALAALLWVALAAAPWSIEGGGTARAEVRNPDGVAVTCNRWLKAALRDRSERPAVLSSHKRVRDEHSEIERFSELLGRPLSAHAVEESAGWTDLHYAALLDMPVVVGALIEAGMAADVRLKTGSPPFGDALKRTLATLGHGEEFRNRTADGETPLMIAAKTNAREAAGALVAFGADIRGTDEFGDTPLHEAALGNARETAEWLVAQGTDIEAMDNFGNTPLHEATQENARETAEWLVAQGADIAAMNEIGDTPLHNAASNNAREVAEFLVAHGADIHGTNYFDETPLHEAARRNAREVAGISGRPRR